MNPLNAGGKRGKGALDSSGEGVNLVKAGGKKGIGALDNSGRM